MGKIRIIDPESDESKALLRTCLHKKCMRIFVHNFVADKAKIRRRAAARQGFLTQYAAKFAEKTCAYAYEDRFSKSSGKITLKEGLLSAMSEFSFKISLRTGFKSGFISKIYGLSVMIVEYSFITSVT